MSDVPKDYWPAGESWEQRIERQDADRAKAKMDAEQRTADQIADWLIGATGVHESGEGRMFWTDIEAILNGEWRT